MIARTWRGVAAAATADAYQRHFTAEIVPNLRRLAGHKGAWLLRRETGEGVEFVAVTLWDSLESVKRFSGADPDAAHIEPAGRAALVDFDTFARHYAVVCDTVGEPG